MILKHYFFSISWAVLILFLTLTSGKISSNMGFDHLDKVVHVFLFCCLCFLLIIANRKQDLPEIKYKAKIWAFLACMVFGAFVECLQLLVPARDFEAMDMVSNSVGATFGILIFFFIYRS